MDVKYDEEAGRLVISFDPSESDSSALLMQLVWEEEWHKGTTVPDLKDDFFMKLAVTRKRFSIPFDYEYFKFVLCFLDETCKERDDNGVDAKALKEFLLLMRGYCSAGHTIH